MQDLAAPLGPVIESDDDIDRFMRHYVTASRITIDIDADDVPPPVDTWVTLEHDDE